MSESENIILRVHFRRQIQPKQYETAEFAAYLEQTFPGSLSPEELEKQFRLLGQIVKVQVFDELNMDYTQDEDTKVILEVFKDSQKVAHVTKAPEAPATPAQSPAVLSAVPDAPTAPPAPPKPAAARRAAPPASEDPWENLASHPEDWWDNSETKTNPKAPDFKNKSGKFKSGNFNMGLWLSNKPDDIVLPDGGYAS